jgi:hypothetical protein
MDIHFLRLKIGLGSRSQAGAGERLEFFLAIGTNNAYVFGVAGIALAIQPH